MRICIPTVEDRGLDSLPHMHFGSAPCFVLHDLARAETKVIRNRNEHHAHGHCHPLKALAGEAVDAVLVGGIGARALARLSAAGIQVFQAQDRTVRENLEAFQQGRLAAFTPALACQGHGHSHDHDHEGGH
jgi:predicted Fe-Mo cluster-binding NifX family protein